MASSLIISKDEDFTDLDPIVRVDFFGVLLFTYFFFSLNSSQLLSSLVSVLIFLSLFLNFTLVMTYNDRVFNYQVFRYIS